MNLEKTEKVMERFFVEREGEGILNVLRNVDLVEEGYLDSLDLISLAAFVEANLGKSVDVTGEETLKSLRRFDSLVALVS